MATLKPSGHLHLEATDIVYSSEENELWRLPITKVRAIGEYTTANGPHVEDYFLVFVTDQASHWHEASYYGQRDDSFRLNLGRLLGNEIRFGLNKSTHWKHRVLWPKDLEGEELFQILPETKSKKILGRLRQTVFPRKVCGLAERVRELCCQE